MENIIRKINIRKIKNSKGEPTVEVIIITKRGKGIASSPSGTSAGKHEVPSFSRNIKDTILYSRKKFFKKLVGMDVSDQKGIDKELKKSMKRIGGAVSTATSLAVAKAASHSNNMELFEYLHKGRKYKLPMPAGKCIGGGAHTTITRSTDFQEFLSIPRVKSFKKAVEINKEMHKTVKEVLGKRIISFKGEMDFEGGWVADMTDEMALRGMESARDEIGAEVEIGVDIAASRIYRSRRYNYRGVMRNPKEQVAYVKSLIDDFDLYYIEDPFDEEDFKSHALLTKKEKKRLIVGDDLFTTNVKRLRQGIKLKACNSIIIKPNQIGTLTDCFETVKLAKKHKYVPVISHRSGETLDNTIAHLAVAWDIPFIKIGIVGKERIAKTRELIRIEKKVK